jgi:hypothetical protein
MALHRQRIGVVHQLDMQMRRRRVAGVTDATDQVARATVSRLHVDRTGRQMSKGREDPVHPHDHVVADDRIQATFGRIERDRGLTTRQVGAESPGGRRRSPLRPSIRTRSNA